MNVLVRVLVEQFNMRGERIVPHHLHSRSALPRVVFTGRFEERDIEVIYPDQLPGDCRPPSRRYRDGDGKRASWKEKSLLKRWRIILLTDTGEVTRRRMARTALTAAIEVGGTGFRISGEHVLDLVRRSQRLVHEIFEKMR